MSAYIRYDTLGRLPPMFCSFFYLSSYNNYDHKYFFLNATTPMSTIKNDLKCDENKMELVF